MASTTLDLPHPFGPTMQVVPVPLKVTTVRSQNDLNPTISTFRSFSKLSPLSKSLGSSKTGVALGAKSGEGRRCISQGKEIRATNPLCSVARQNVWQVLDQRPSRLARGWRFRESTVARGPTPVKGAQNL